MTLDIAGFGDEVVYACALFFGFMVACLIYLSMNRPLFTDFDGLLSWIFGYFSGSASTATSIHPDPGDPHGVNPLGPDDARSAPTRTVYNLDNNCPICLNACQYAALANCGHVYCCQCIISYWRYGTWLSAVACPVCRTQITLLMPNFSEADLEDPERRRASADLRSYNRRFSNQPRPFMDYIRDIPVLVPNLLGQLFTLSGLMLMFRLRVLLLLFAAALYIISPLDILPEAFFGLFGLVDDLFVGFVVLIYLCMAYRQFLRT